MHFCGTRMTGGKILEEAVVYIFSKRPWKRSEDDMMDHWAAGSFPIALMSIMKLKIDHVLYHMTLELLSP